MLPMVTMVANENWIEFTLRYVVDYKRRRGVMDQLFTGILEEIDRNQDKVGIAASTLNIEKLAPLEIRLPEGFIRDVSLRKPDQGMEV